MNNEPNTEPIAVITEAPMETKEALIDTNKTDIEPISYSIEDAPEHLEKETPNKKPRSEKQIIAFAKAQEALKAKRILRKQEKDKLPKPKRGRPIKVKKEEEEVEEEVEEDTDEEDVDEEVYITTRRKKRSQKKTKPKPKRRIVYVSESDSSSSSESETDEDEEEQYLQYPSSAPPPMSPFDGLRFL